MELQLLVKSDVTPIFVVGSARSGTTMIGKLLFSSEDCYKYTAETLLLTVCRKRYGDIFKSGDSKTQFLSDWFRSRQFKRSNLNKDEFLSLFDKSNNYSELLINFLSAMADKAGKRYIVDSTPANVGYINEILHIAPNAKFIWMVRDGRDVSLSQERLGWVNPPHPFTSKSDRLNYTLMNWAKVNDRFKENKNVYLLRYEDFLSSPECHLKSMALYLGTNFDDYDLETVLNPEKPNSAFGRLGTDHNNSTIARWKSFDPKLISEFSFGCQSTLSKLGYPTTESQFSIRKAFRYLVFNIHLSVKTLLTKFHFFSKLTSETLEVDKK